MDTKQGTTGGASVLGVLAVVNKQGTASTAPEAHNAENTCSDAGEQTHSRVRAGDHILMTVVALGANRTTSR